MNRRTLAWRDRAHLPTLPGCYWVYARNLLLYVGTSKNLQERHTDNFGRGAHHLEETLQNAGATRIRYKIIRNEARRLHTEALAIRDLDPPFNTRKEPLNRWLLFLDNLQQVVWAVMFFLSIALILLR